MLSWLEGIAKGTTKIPTWVTLLVMVGALVGGVIILCLPVWYTMLAWNLFVPSVFGMRSLDFLQALGLDLCLLPATLVAVANIRVSDK